MDGVLLLASANMELNVRHREALKPELHMRYLCDPSNPVTAEHFGDDMPTVVKDITDANRITSKLYNKKTDSERRGRSEVRPDRFQGHKTSSPLVREVLGPRLFQTDVIFGR